ncbi:MAG: metallophosphoesterase [Victivallaceae bacterium]
MSSKLSNSFRLAHLSDIHFNYLTFNIFSCFNKRFKGLLRRIFCNLQFENDFLCENLPSYLKQENVDLVCITGDLTLTALPKEFLKARSFVDEIENLDITVDVIPGNHDVYTNWDFNKKTFYRYFPNDSLQNQKVSFKNLNDFWCLISLDCSYKNTWCSANGIISPEQITTIENFLFSIPERTNVVISNHYPLLPAKKSYRDLINGKLLRDMLKKFSNIKLYLHGHDHQACLYEFKDGNPNLIVNGGSTSLKSNSQFNLIDLLPNGCRITNIPIATIEQDQRFVLKEPSYEIEF